MAASVLFGGARRRAVDAVPASGGLGAAAGAVANLRSRLSFPAAAFAAAVSVFRSDQKKGVGSRPTATALTVVRRGRLARRCSWFRTRTGPGSVGLSAAAGEPRPPPLSTGPASRGFGQPMVRGTTRRVVLLWKLSKNTICGLSIVPARSSQLGAALHVMCRTCVETCVEHPITTDDAGCPSSGRRRAATASVDAQSGALPARCGRRHCDRRRRRM